MMKYKLLFGLIFLPFSSPLIADYEPLPTFQAKDVLPAQLLDGPNHNVQPLVTSNGYQNRYVVESSYGEFEALGTLNLRKNIREADAFAYLEAMSKTKVFIDSLAAAGVETAVAIGKAFTTPIQTVKGIPGGVTRLFSGYVTSTKRGVATTQNMMDGPGGEMSPEDFKELNYLVSDVERKWASELKTDPYTSNIKLRKAITEMAVVEYIGGLPVDFALPAVGSVAVSVLQELGDKIYLQDAQELELDNRTCLNDAGIKADTIEAFFASSYLTPTMHTIFCGAVERLEGVKNLDLAANQLSRTASFEETRFLLNAVGLLAWYQGKHNSIDRITSRTRMPYGVTSSNELVAMVPGDFLIWSAAIESNLNQIDDEGRPYTSKSLWMIGKTSELARQQFAKRGWNIHDRTNDEQMAAFYDKGLTAIAKSPESVERE
jgi:hypothetical protein